ncbi:hypothetical protein ACWEJ6_52700 [Nonomuraea sp. NPDC004702]
MDIYEAIYRSSGTGRAPERTVIPGVTPAFYLSPGDAFHFPARPSWATSTPPTSSTQLWPGSPRHGDHHSESRNKHATQHFDHAATMFGDLAGIEFKAVSDVPGQADAIDELVIDLGTNTLALGIDSVPVAHVAIDLTWTVAKTYAVSRLLDGWAERFETGVEKPYADMSTTSNGVFVNTCGSVVSLVTPRGLGGPFRRVADGVV